MGLNANFMQVFMKLKEFHSAPNTEGDRRNWRVQLNIQFPKSSWYIKGQGSQKQLPIWIISMGKQKT